METSAARSLRAARPAGSLAGPLEHVRASYREPAAWASPPGPETAEQRAGRLAAYTALILDEPAAAARLHSTAARLSGIGHLEGLLGQAVTDAMTLMDAELCDIQLVDPRDGSLVLVAHAGFGPAFLEHFAVVDDADTACGRAARQGAQAMVADARDEQAFAPHQQVFAAAGVRAILSTPLTDHSGHMIGMISTLDPRPGPPSGHRAQIMNLYSQLAGEAIARHLPPAPRRTARPPRAPGPPPTDEFMNDTVNRLYTTGLHLAGARQTITDPHAAHHIQAGIDALDDTIRAVQRAALAVQPRQSGAQDSR